MPPLQKKMYSKVRGVTFYQIQFDTIRINDELVWQRDPGNQYDRNAISLWHNENQVGHIAKEIAAELAPLLDANDVNLKVVVSAITGGLDGKTNGINIELTVDYKMNSLASNLITSEANVSLF